MTDQCPKPLSGTSPPPELLVHTRSHAARAPPQLSGFPGPSPPPPALRKQRDENPAELPCAGRGWWCRARALHPAQPRRSPCTPTAPAPACSRKSPSCWEEQGQAAGRGRGTSFCGKRWEPSPPLLLQSQRTREAENRRRWGKHTLYGTDLLKQSGPSEENQLLALIIAYVFISRTRKISADKYTFHQNAFG